MVAPNGSLIVHCGGEKVQFEDVRRSRTPDPSGDHYPIPHAALYDLVIAGLQKQGLTVVGGEHVLAQGGDRYFGLLRLRNGGEDHPDYELIAGVRNTHDKSYSAGMALGSRVFVCDNLAFSGEVTFGRKHTRHILRDLPRLAADALGRLGALKRSQEERIEGYKAFEMNDEKAYATMVHALRSKVVSASKLGKVLGEWHEPRHKEFEPRTGWSLFNSFTEVLKLYRIEENSARSQRLHGLLDSACGLQLAEKHVEVN